MRKSQLQEEFWIESFRVVFLSVKGILDENTRKFSIFTASSQKSIARAKKLRSKILFSLT